MSNKYLKKDPADLGETVSFEAIQQGFVALKTLVAAKLKLELETVVLCISDPKTVQPVRVLTPALDALMDVDLSEAAAEILQSRIDQCIAEFAENGINITEETLNVLVPPTDDE